VFQALQISKHQFYVSKGNDFSFISKNLPVSSFLYYFLSVVVKAQPSNL
jgi:hypothetical protein